MNYKGHELIITYKRIKRINARVREGRILVSAPYFTSEKIILDFLDSNYSRIEKILKNQVNLDPNVMYVWGNKYDKVLVQSADDNVLLMGDIAYVFYKDNPDAVLDDFYAKETISKLNEVARKYVDLMVKENIMFNKIKVKKMTSRWGSCICSKKNISINSNLAKYDPICLEYVFCHEIAHIKYPNHSKSFHNFIYTYFKDEKIAKEILKKHY
ncbi:MAG: M48 family metallopeptidase [Acholeplasmatales bacterium]|nr:M48 family metallopeptidase [Acholeplasmatales bacterium]